MRNIRYMTVLAAVIISAVFFLAGNGNLFSQTQELSSTPSAEDAKIIKTLSLTNADITSVMMYLSAYSGINIVVSPKVDAQITMRLANVTWRQALDIILETYGLVGVEQQNYIRVVKAEDYFAEKRALEQHNAEQASLKNLRTRIIRIKYNVAKDLTKAMQGILSMRGTVAVDERTNSLILRDLPENLDKAEELLGVLDRETKQIKISAQLLEVESTVLKEAGFDWRVISSKAHALPTATYDGSSATNEDYIPEQDLGIGASNQMTGAAIGDFKLSAVKDDYMLDAMLKMAESTNKVKVIAHPEVTTVDNIEAFIQMGQKIPIKQFDPSGNTIITFYDVGIQMRVTPHITSENRILLHLKPERSSYQYDPNGVIINTQNAETNVVVDNGQTAVIGGLTKQEELSLRVGLPYLKDIPLLGYLFSYNKKSITNQDLVIFVTPTIVDEQLSGNQ